jgi:hypothetical protein
MLAGAAGVPATAGALLVGAAGAIVVAGGIVLAKTGADLIDRAITGRTGEPLSVQRMFNEVKTGDWGAFLGELLNPLPSLGFLQNLGR